MIEILEKTATNDNYKNINVQILNRISDRLAHGSLSFEISNINNIMKTELEITDGMKENSNLVLC